MSTFLPPISLRRTVGHELLTLNDRLIENRGASLRDHTSARVEKENKKNFTGTSVPLDRAC